MISHKWSIGTVQTRKFNLPGALPIFLIGYDVSSQSWLEKNKQKLIELNATGLVINVQTVSQMQELREIVPTLTLIPSPADALSERLGISHYPLLITSEGASQ